MVSKRINGTQEDKINKIIILLFGILLFITPLIIFKSFFNAAIFTKYFFSEIIILIILFLGFISVFVQKKNLTIVYHPIQLPIICFMLYIIIRSIFHPLPLVGLKESISWILWLSLSLLLIQHIKIKQQVDFLIICLLVTSVLSSIHGIAQYYGYELKYLEWKGKPPTGMYIVIGTLGNSNFLAEYLIPVFFLTLCWFVLKNESRKMNVLGMISVVIIGFCIWLTGANEIWFSMPLLILLLIIFILIVIYRIQKKVNGKNEYQKVISHMAKWMGICIFGILVLITGLSSKSDNWDILKNQYKKVYQRQTYSDRLMVWEVAHQMIIDKPVFGWGMGKFRIHYLDELASLLRDPSNSHLTTSANSTKGSNANQAHNDYLQLAADLGLVGMAIFFWILITYFWTILKYLWKTDNFEWSISTIGFFMAFMAILMDAICNFPFFLPVTGLLFWAILGTSIASCNLVKDTNNLSKLNYFNGFFGKPILVRTSAIFVIILFLYLGYMIRNQMIGNIALKDGIRLYIQNKWDEADIKFQKALYYDSTLGEAYLRRSEILMNRKEYKEAVRMAFLSFQYGTDDIERYIILAKAILLNGEPQRAIEILTTASILYPNYSIPYQLQAEIYSDYLHKPEKSIELWKKYILSGVTQEERIKAINTLNQLK